MMHRWKIYRSGGVDQVALSTHDDLLQLANLDPKLWVALSMPTTGVHVDRRTLALLDGDRDGYVRRPEILAAVAWMCKAYKDPATLFAGGDAIALDQIADGPILAGARRLLANLGKPDARSVTIADAVDAAARFVNTLSNGDGVIPADAATGEARQVIEDIIATRGSLPDRSGKPGVDQQRIAEFFAAARALVAWHEGAGPEVASLAAAADAIAQVESKVDDFFTRCRLAKFDARAAALLAPDDARLAALAGKTLSLASSEVADLPLARVAADGSLPLDGAVNPAWQERITELARAAVAPLFGTRSALDEAAWTAVVARVAPYRAWQAARPVSPPAASAPPAVAPAAPAAAPATPPVASIEALGVDRLRTALAHQPAVEDALARDLAVKPEVDSIADVEKLCYFHRDLGALLANFVNFAAFYGMRGAVFQAGTLFLDARACSLVFEVLDPVKHATLGPMSGAYLAYCDCTRDGQPKKAIVAAITAGDVDNLFVGRNGVFVDRDGQDWQATVTKLVDNPISIRQAFWLPYKKLARTIEERIAKRAAVAATESQAQLESSTIGAELAPPPAPPGKRVDVGTVAALGVAVGGIAAAVTALLSGIFGLGKWAPLGVAGILLAISAPSMLLAYMKLLRRNLGPLLDANGWAINVLTRINVPFGTALTVRATLPSNAERSLGDPYAERRRPWRLYLALVVLVVLAAAWYFGRLDAYLPAAVTSRAVLGVHANAR